MGFNVIQRFDAVIKMIDSQGNSDSQKNPRNQSANRNQDSIGLKRFCGNHGFINQCQELFFLIQGLRILACSSCAIARE